MARRPSSPGRYLWSLSTGSGMISAPSRSPVIATDSYHVATERNQCWVTGARRHAAVQPPDKCDYPERGVAMPGSSGRGAGRVAEDRDDAPLADPVALVGAPGQHVVEVGDQVDA